MSKLILDDAYPGKDLEAMSFAKNYSKWIIELFNPFIGNNVAEIGAGSGNLTQLLAEQEFISNITAFEPSKKMFSQLVDRLSLNKKIITINNTLMNESYNHTNKFDSVFYINVLEHIKDDNTEVIHISSILKSGGYACIFVPALSWLYSEFDESIGHYRRYHKNELIDLFTSNGFEIVLVKYIDMFGILPWYLNFVLMKKMLNPKATKIYDNLAIPIIRKLDKHLPNPIGKNLLLVGKKTTI